MPTGNQRRIQEQRGLRRFVGWFVVLIALTSSMPPSPAAGQFVIDADYDNGSLDLANTTIVGNTIQLSGRDNFNPGSWKWLNFSVSEVAGSQLTFEIDDNFATGASRLDNHAMVYSYDRDNWFFFDNNDHNNGQQRFTFFNNGPFTEHTVFVAYGLPYSYQDVVGHTALVRQSTWVTAPTSADTNLVIGQSPGGIDDLGRAISQRDIFGYRITDPSNQVSKAKIVISSGVHANESLANHTVEGLVNFLISDEFSAAALRKVADFYVYPMTNVDGRFAGYNRSTVQHIDRDPNRFWREDLYADMNDIQTVAEAMKTDTGQQIEYFIDFHSATDTSQHYGILDFDLGFHLDPFWQNLLALEPSLGSQDASLINWTAQKFGLERLDADFTMTFETEFIPGENIDRFHDLGRNVGMAFEQSLVLLADINFDGLLDADDWLVFVANLESDLSGLPQIDAYQRGDLNLDGANNVVDFGLFKSTYEQTNGAGSFAAMLANIPEPNSLLMMTALAIPFVVWRRSRQWPGPQQA